MGFTDMADLQGSYFHVDGFAHELILLCFIHKHDFFPSISMLFWSPNNKVIVAKATKILLSVNISVVLLACYIFVGQGWSMFLVYICDILHSWIVEGKFGTMIHAKQESPSWYLKSTCKNTICQIQPRPWLCNLDGFSAEPLASFQVP